MRRISPNLIAIPLTVVLGLAGISTLAGAFTASERDTITAMKTRLTNLERRATDLEGLVTALQAADAGTGQQLATITDDITSLYANDQGISADIDTLNANDQTLQQSFQSVDTGLKDLVSDTGPLHVIDQHVADLQQYTWTRVPAVILTDINPIVTCGDTTCTVDVEWHATPASTGQVEWGETTAYGNLTRPQTTPLDYHKQRIGTFPKDGKTYHFRILASVPEGTAQSADGTAIAG